MQTSPPDPSPETMRYWHYAGLCPKECPICTPPPEPIVILGADDPEQESPFRPSH